jgi:hypothetical protein
MVSNLRVAIITHEIDKFEGSNYLLRQLSRSWEQDGIEIAIVKGVNQPLPEADIAILHTDITAIGDDYIHIIDHYPRVINGTVTDISKTVFSDLIVAKNDGYTGKVIVKTNANFGGMRERQHKLSKGDWQANIGIQRPWRRVEWMEEYPIFDSPSSVPGGVWRNDRLVVEKFLPEQNPEDEFVVKIWVFFGDQGIYYQCVSNERVIKGHNLIRREFLDVKDVPESIREVRAKMGFDYGKFDFAMHRGEAVLYDVNRTPGGPAKEEESEVVAQVYRTLNTGFRNFINQH